MSYRFAFGRPPAVAARGMVATSQPLATRAGLRMLEQGGNAADAALAAAAVLLRHRADVDGDRRRLLRARLARRTARRPRRGRAGAALGAPRSRRSPSDGPALGDRAGRRRPAGRRSPSDTGGSGSTRCLADAIDAAEDGFAVAPRTAASLAARRRPAEELGPAPSVGEIVRLPELGATLRRIAERRPGRASTEGRVAAAIASASWLEEDDLAGFAPRWVEPLRLTYRGTEVVELPPPTQGVVALEALGLLERSSPSLASRIRCVKLALEDGLARVRDGADVSELIDPGYLDRRRSGVEAPVAEPPGGTVYLCAVDEDRMAVSFIQSLYEAFGSGVVAPGTGVALQNRGACFAVSGAVEPGTRPYHTIIPGMLLRDGDAARARSASWAASSRRRPTCSSSRRSSTTASTRRRRSTGRASGSTATSSGSRRGSGSATPISSSSAIATVRETNTFGFGGGQAILVQGDALVGGSDPRKDGYAAGL